MDFGRNEEPRIQIDEAEPLAVASARVHHELDRAYLRDVVGMDGEPVLLPVGAKVTFFAGPSVVFVGVAQDDQSVLDMLSCEDDDGEYVDF